MEIEILLTFVALHPTSKMRNNVSRMSPKLLQTQPHIVENRGITMASLFLSLTS